MSALTRLGRALRGRPRLLAASAVGLASLPFMPSPLAAVTRALLAWDIGATTFLLLATQLFASERARGMRGDAAAQEQGEWTVFAISLGAVAASFAALVSEFSAIKSMGETDRGLHVALIAATLVLSWLLTHVMFAMRYAHEYYEHAAGLPSSIHGGLAFPGDSPPDYWDFVYFSFVLGMTFQVSDVDITSRKMRRLATVHGVLGFLFNTVIVALTVNIAAGFL